jgi:hypothetical protein
MIVMRRRLRCPLTVTALLVLLAGCGGGPDRTPEGDGPSDRPAPGPARSSHAGYGDLLVAGRPVTGSEPSGLRQIPYRRTYADGELYATVTGYRSLAYGKAGLEAVYDAELSAGRDVATTIDPAAQQAAFTALGDREGSAVALDAGSGDLLAVVSTPSYDPGDFAGNRSSDMESWRAVTEDGRQPLRNRAFVDAVPPGGTFDVVIAAAALEHGLYRTVDEPTRAGGGGDCAGASLRGALGRACGEVFEAVADALGPDKLERTARRLGFDGRRLFVPTRVEPSRYDGGGAVATTVQMARVAAALADGGRLVVPRMVDEGKKPDAPAVSERTAGALFPVVRSTRTWAPAETEDGTPLSWSLSYARTGEGRTIAVAARVADAGAGAAARVTRQVAASLS